MDFKLTESQMLKYAMDNGIIDMNTLRIQIEMNERKKYLEKHSHKTWQGTNGFYYTKVDDETKKDGKRLIKKKTEHDLENAIIAYYKECEDEPTLKEIFYQWTGQKMRYGEVQKQTIERYETDFQRFFVSTGFAARKIKYLTALELEDFIKRTIYDCQLTAKAWGNLRTILNGMFRHAKKNGYTDLSITSFLGDLDISKRAFQKRYKDDMECIFSENELGLLIKHLTKKPTLPNFGVLLAAYTGMRVGEIVALKWEDIGEKSIYVHRTQVIYHDESGSNIHEIRDMPKTEAGIRRIVIVDSLRPILKNLRMINPFTEYVFENNGKVITKNLVEKAIYRACDKLEIPRRSMHALRKTYATKLINSHIDEAIIINQLGHTDIATTKGYYYFNDKSLDTMQEMISRAINY